MMMVVDDHPTRLGLELSVHVVLLLEEGRPESESESESKITQQPQQLARNSVFAKIIKEKREGGTAERNPLASLRRRSE